jgi:hypothetical protein
MSTVTVYDETTGGGQTHELTLEFLDERITVRELIRSRVYQEVTEYNARMPEYFRGLVQPTDAERVLNGYRVRERRKLDWDGQYEKAVKAFQGNGFMILVDDRQLIDLDEEIEVRHDSAVTFLKLVPLVDAIPPIRRPTGGPGRPRFLPKKLHGDKGYDYLSHRRALRRRSIAPRIARRGVESAERLGRYHGIVQRTIA